MRPVPTMRGSARDARRGRDGRDRWRHALTAVWVAAALLLVWGLPQVQAAEPAWPVLSGRVVDGAGIIPADARQRLDDKLKAHEDKTSDQLVVATVPALQGLTIEDFANGLFRHWQIGQKAKNNGVLLIVAPTERKVRIEVGYGLEGALTDALSSTIITTAIAPKFRNGDFAGGIDAGVDAILSVLAGDAEQWQRRAEIRSDESTLAEDIAVVIAMILIVLFIISFLRGVSRPGGVQRHRTRDGRWIVLPPNQGSGWGSGSGWGGGGGGWSSGGGGFSGGGGSSGGGGASGSW